MQRTMKVLTIGNYSGVTALILVGTFWVFYIAPSLSYYPFGFGGIFVSLVIAVITSLIASVCSGPRWLAATFLAMIALWTAAGMLH
jgi:hypothetical protein